MHKVEECKQIKVATLLRYIDSSFVLRPWAHSLYNTNNNNTNNNNNLWFLFSSLQPVHLSLCAMRSKGPSVSFSKEYTVCGLCHTSMLCPSPFSRVLHSKFPIHQSYSHPFLFLPFLPTIFILYNKIMDF